MSSPQSTRRRESTGMLAVAVVGAPVIILLMLLAFLTPAINSGAEDLPLTVSAPPEQREQLISGLDAAGPGVFDVTIVDDADAVVRAVQDRDAIGGIAVGADGVEVVTASGAGTPYTPLLRSLATGLQAQVQQQAGAAAAAAADSVTVTDVAPLPAGDANGVGLAALALPLVFGGMATAALVSIVLRTAPWKRAVAALVIAALGSLAATVALHSWFDAVAGGFWLIWAGLTAGIAAISLTLIGLHAVAGYAGLALGAVTMMFVSNPLAGLATGPQWLPHGWGAFGQGLPVGATGTWLRSAAYFDGRGMGGAPWVLLAWAVAGLVLLGIGAWRGRTGAAAPTAGPEAVAEGAGA